MTTEGPGAEDLLLERLKQSAAGDAAVRQMRRRYDLLRRDYESLIDRLGELEDRLAAEPVPAAALPPPSAVRVTAEQAGTTVQECLVGPLLRLRDEYVAAASGIQSIVSGLDGLAAAAFKGQRPATAGLEPAAATTERPHLRGTRFQVEAKGSDFGALLDFQERLSDIPGVARVSINAIDNERATLLVELEPPTAPE